MSDGDDPDGTPAKRQYSTMPVSRNGSPRKSLKSLYPAGPGSSENVPPLPSHVHHLSPAPAAGPETARIQLSPLSSNELNGAPRPPGSTQSPAPGSFTAVNTAGFTAVNNTPPAREPSREPPRQPSREPQQPSPLQKHPHGNSYTSPYEPPSRSSAPVQPAPGPAAPPNSVPSNHRSPATHRPELAPAATVPSNRGSPAIQHAHHAHHAHIAPQPQPQPQVAQQAPLSAAHSLPLHTQSQASPYAQAPPHPHIHPQQQPPKRSPSRANTPGHSIGRSLAPHPTSRSSTPLAQAATNQPPTAPNQQSTLAPPTQSAPAYGIQIVPTQDTPAASNNHRPPPTHIQPATCPHQPLLKSQASEPLQIVQPQAVARPAITTSDFRLLQCEVTAGLFTFFFPRSVAPPDEPALLQRLHTLWYHGEHLFRAELGPHFDLISKILTSWLHERQAITALRHSLASQPGVSSVGLVDRLLAMNDLRVMRLKWKNMSTVDGLSPEDLLCQAFRVMTNTEGSEYLFKDGLERLNTGVFEFLRSEDAKIVMQRR
jgi:hypothetical protein